MGRDLLVFRTAHKNKDTFGLMVIISWGFMQVYNSKYNYHPIGQYSVQTNSIFYSIQEFLKSPILIERYHA